MSARTARFVRTALATAAAAATGAVALVPTTALAATPGATSTSPITLKVTAAAPAGTFTPGGAAKTITVTASNTSGRPARFTANLGGAADGALGLKTSDYTFAVTPVHAPATSGVLFTQDGGVMGSFYPKGGRFSDSFSIPAHTSYTWKLSLAISRSWPINDNGLRFTIGANYQRISKSFDFKVGNRNTGGPVVERFVGSATIAPDRPAYETLTVTNRTGAALNDPIGVALNDTPYGGAATAVDVWKNGHWTAVRDGDTLATLGRGLANGAQAAYRLRIREVGTDKPGTKLTIGAISWSKDRGPISYDNLSLIARQR